jgi:hypothetical protein
MQGSRTIVIVGVLSMAMTGTTWAGSKRRPTYEELEERVRRLERIISEHGLDKPAQVLPAPIEAQPVPHPTEREQVEKIVEEKLSKQKPIAGWKDGFYLESPDGSYKLKLKGYLQAQGRFPCVYRPTRSAIPAQAERPFRAKAITRSEAT